MFDKVLNTPLIQKNIHYVKSVQIRSFSSPYFPLFWLNTGKYGPEKSPYLDTFHAVYWPDKIPCSGSSTSCETILTTDSVKVLRLVADYNLWHSSIGTFVVSGTAYRHLILQFSVLFIMSLNYVNWKLKMAKQIYQMNEQNQVLGVNFFGFSRLQRSFLPNQTLIQWNLYKADTIGAKKCEL